MVLYAVTSRGTRPGHGLRAYAGELVDVLYEDRAEPPARTVQEVLAFGTKLQQAAEAGPVLPVRYGTVIADDQELLDLVATREGEWAGALARVAGHVELIVHVRFAPPVPTAGADTDQLSGAEFLRRRAAHWHSRDAARAGLLDAVGPRLADHRPLPGTDEDRLALLVPADQAEAARRAVYSWAAAEPELTVDLSGPWPPFSFCDEVGS